MQADSQLIVLPKRIFKIISLNVFFIPHCYSCTLLFPVPPLNLSTAFVSFSCEISFILRRWEWERCRTGIGLWIGNDCYDDEDDDAVDEDEGRDES